MKFNLLLPLSFLLCFGLIGCSGEDPEPEQAKNFTGCRLIKVTSINEFSKGGTDQLSFVYHYDNQNRIIKEDVLSKAGAVINSYTYNYDSQGKLVLEDRGNTTTHLTYDNTGKLIEKRQYNSGSGGTPILGISFLYTYNSLNQPDSMKSYNHYTGTPKLQWGEKYKFFPDGNLKSVNSFVVQNNGVIDTVNQPYNYFNNYDTYKNPYAQASYTLKQLEPSMRISKNNPKDQLYSQGGNPTKFTLLYKYNSDSLVTEKISVENDVKTEFFYDCN